MDPQYGILSMPGTGFFGMLVIGFLAGWIAERTMNRDHGFLTNILVGIAGSFVGGTLAGLLGINFYGFLGNLVVAIVGAILILWLFGRARPSNPSRIQAMVTVLDTLANRPASAIRKRRTGRTRRCCASRTGSASRRRSRSGYAGDARDRALAQPRHRLRGSRLPEHRRVLGQEARDLHDHGRDLHPRLRFLQCRHRHARTRSTPTEPENVAQGGEPRWA